MRSPQRQSPIRQLTPSPKKHLFVRPSPVKSTPRGGFEFNFEKRPKEDKENEEPAPKPTARFEVYSKIFGPPPQISIGSLEKDTTTIKVNDSISIPASEFEQPRFKSPQRKVDPRPAAKKRTAQTEIATPLLGRPVRNEPFAIPSVPAPPGPPQLPPPSIPRNITKRFAAQSVLPSPAQQPPGALKSALPRPAGKFTRALPVPATRRSSRVPKVVNDKDTAAKTSNTTIGFTTPAVSAALPEKKVAPVPSEMPVVVEKSAVLVPLPVPPPSENITIERPKGKLGGAQRVNPNAKPEPEPEPKKVNILPSSVDCRSKSQHVQLDPQRLR
jgi:hypothetical protein